MKRDGDGTPPGGPPEGTEQDTAADLLGGFPRHLTRDLVESEEERRKRRVPLAGAALAAALSLLALGLPTERLHGPGPALVDAAAEGAWGSTRAVWSASIQLVDGLPGLRTERAAFLASGLALGATVWLAWRIGARVGATEHRRVLVCLLVAGAPAAWVAGTSPGPEALAALGATGAFLALLQPAGARGRALGAGVGWLVAAGAAPLSVWWLPAAAWGVARGRGGWRGALVGALWALGCLLAWLALTAGLHHVDGSGLWGWRDLAFALRRDVLVGFEGPSDPRWLVAPVVALGVLLAGFVGLRRAEADARRDCVWVVAWLLLPAAGTALGGRATWELPWLWALGPLALGAHRLFAQRPAFARRAGTALVVLAALGGALGGRLALRADDPLATWRATLEREWERGDVLLTTDADRLYLARRRYGLRAFDLGGLARLSPGYRAEELAALERRLTPAREAGARLVLDRRPDAQHVALDAVFAELEREGAVAHLPWPPTEAPAD